MSTIQELLAYGKRELENSGNEYAKYERKVLLEEVLQMQYLQMLMNGDQEVSPKQEEQYRNFIAKRVEHYPLQYLTGCAHFMDFMFYVNEHVLIPRNDTEVLVEFADAVIKKHSGDTEQYELLDLCCGSGCIGISLKLYHPEISLTLSDVSRDALQVAKGNCENHQVDADILCGDLFSEISGKYHMIVCNPPYIEQDVIPTLMPEVKDYEPMLALDGGKSGLDFYERITNQAGAYLHSGGYLFYEIGHNQGIAVTEMMEKAGFLDVCVEKDYAGLDRVVYGHL